MIAFQYLKEIERLSVSGESRVVLLVNFTVLDILFMLTIVSMYVTMRTIEFNNFPPDAAFF